MSNLATFAKLSFSKSKLINHIKHAHNLNESSLRLGRNDDNELRNYEIMGSDTLYYSAYQKWFMRYYLDYFIEKYCSLYTGSNIVIMPNSFNTVELSDGNRILSTAFDIETIIVAYHGDAFSTSFKNCLNKIYDLAGKYVDLRIDSIQTMGW